MTQVVVVIPGIMGSTLHLGPELIWPGTPWELVGKYKKMTELLRPDLVATDLIRSFTAFSTQYQSLIDDLNACDFTEASTPPTLYLYPYDWRKSIESAADGLADRLDQAAAQHGGALELSLVAHSMGGLVARHYIEGGRFSTRPAYGALRRLITLGTPHRGSPLALTAAMGMEKRLFLSADQVRELARDPRYPSLYQLLPPADEPFAWDFDAGGEYTSVDIFTPPTAGGLGLVGENLQAAQALHRSLDLGRRPATVRYFFFAGTRQVTPSASALQRGGARYTVRNIEPEDAGDGTVPIWSATLTGIQNRPVGGEHGTIYQNDDLRRTLGALLGKAGVLAAAAAGIELAIRDPVVEPEQAVHAALTFSSGLSQVDGELSLERAQVTADGRITGYNAFGTPYAVSYSGLAAEKLAVVFEAPNVTGFYRLTYYPRNAAEGAASDELIVQEPP
jgi:pimeloyl-ACP methyl ester carboxylesterase